MLDDLRWEYKALILIGIVTISIVIYSYSYFNSGERERISDSSPVEPQPQPVPINIPNMTSENTSSSTENVTAEEARQIAGESGYTAGQPSRGSITINGTDVPVWVVPLQRGGRTVREVYVSIEGGQIVGKREFQ